ncbi:hypothetical protein [Burkholderia cepacia]|uniref:hypothetical protein n=1 Tax=Burkholderia cepacia TaxID=292 RepID=UPI003C79C3C0
MFLRITLEEPWRDQVRGVADRVYQRPGIVNDELVAADAVPPTSRTQVMKCSPEGSDAACGRRELGGDVSMSEGWTLSSFGVACGVIGVSRAEDVEASGVAASSMSSNPASVSVGAGDGVNLVAENGWFMARINQKFVFGKTAIGVFPASKTRQRSFPHCSVSSLLDSQSPNCVKIAKWTWSAGGIIASCKI